MKVASRKKKVVERIEMFLSYNDKRKKINKMRTTVVHHYLS